VAECEAPSLGNAPGCKKTHKHTRYMALDFVRENPDVIYRSSEKKTIIRPLSELTIGGDDLLTEEWEVISNQFSIPLRMLNNNIPVTLLIW